MSVDMSRVPRGPGPAVTLSLLLHVTVFAAWPHISLVANRPVLVHGELLAPQQEPPPVVAPPPPPPPPPPPEPAPAPRIDPVPRAEPAPARPDTGVALPLLAEKVDVAPVGADDFVVADVPPLAPDDPLPLASRPGDVSLHQYIPAADAPGDGTGQEDPVDAALLADYGRILQERAGKLGGYPALAQKRRWQGRVKIIVRYARSGAAYQIAVKEASGHKILDDRALEMVTQACAAARLPETLARKAFSVVVPVEFKLL